MNEKEKESSKKMFSQFKESLKEERRPRQIYDEESKDYENDDDFGDEPPPCMMLDPKKPKKSPSKFQPGTDVTTNKAGVRVREDEEDYELKVTEVPGLTVPQVDVPGTSAPESPAPETSQVRFSPSVDLRLPLDKEKNVRNDNRFFISKSLNGDGSFDENVSRIIADDVTGKTRQQGTSKQRVSKLPSDTSYECMHRPHASHDGETRGTRSDEALYSSRVQRIMWELEEREDAMLQRDMLLKKRVELLKNREDFLQVFSLFGLNF